MGNFANTVPLRLELSGELSFVAADADGRRVYFSDVGGLSSDEIVAKVTSLHADTGTVPRPKWKPKRKRPSSNSSKRRATEDRPG